MRMLSSLATYCLLVLFSLEGAYPSEYMALEGVDVDLQCVTTSTELNQEENSVVWRMRKDENLDWIELGKRHDGQSTTSRSRFMISGNFSLTIESAQLNDTGFYACSINTNDSVTENATFNNHFQLIVKDILEKLETETPTFHSSQPSINVLGPTEVLVSWLPIEKTTKTVFYVVIVRDRLDNESSKDAVHRTNFHFEDLRPNTEYQFRVEATDTNGIIFQGLPSDWICTNQSAPDGRVHSVSSKTHSDQIRIDFELPPSFQWNGNLTGFRVIYSVVGGSADTNVKREFTILGINEEYQTFNISHLMPFTVYDIKIAVFNEAGIGPFTESLQIMTDEGVPTKPQILNIPSRNESSLTVHWQRPEHLNGELLGYVVFWGNGFKMDSSQVKASQRFYEIAGLSPYTKYDIQVSAFTKIGSGLKSDVHQAITDVAAPSVPTMVNISSNQSDTVIVRWWRPLNYTRQIDLYLIKYRIEDDLIYRSMKWNSFDDDDDLFEVSVPNLFPNTVYEFQVAAVTCSIFTDHEFTSSFSEVQKIKTLGLTDMTDDGEDQRGSSILTLGVISGVLCCLIIIGGIIIFIISRHLIRTRYQFIADQDAGKVLTSNVIMSEIYDPNSCQKESIPVELFKDHVIALHADGDYLLSQEYEEINRMTPSNSSTSQSCDDENKPKNRYLNILAYDHARVVLSQLPGKPRQSDYINANFINGYKKSKAFIATQGPLPSTFVDFWRMVWEQESTIIVMITNLTEKGRRKCDQYWPNEGEHQYDNIIVRLVRTRITAHYTVRTFTVKQIRHKKKSSSERTVFQYHYTDWPDHGVPNYTLPTLTFIRKSSAAAAATNTGPVIVHCSAGVGRTGTYIVIDSMIKQIKEVQSVNVFGFLCNIRNQRNYLVQTEDQYSFIHDAICEFIENGETEIKDADITSYLKNLQTESENNESLLERQYKLAVNFVPKPYQLTSSLSSINESKNRTQEYLPVDLSRVFLPVKAGVDGSDYINASFLQGYGKNDEYIITQHPLLNTIDDFWLMVWDQNSVTIVLLSATDDQDFKCFWPEKTERTDCGHFQVSFREEEKLGNSVVTRRFLLQSTQDDYECTVQMFEHTSWPQNACQTSNIYDLIKMVKDWNGQHQETSGPIIVIDSFGGRTASAFCAISTLFDQLCHEGCIDIYALAKLYHMKRPGVFPSVEDYVFMYKATEGIYNEMNHSGENYSDVIGNCNNCTPTPTTQTQLQNLSHSISHTSVHSNHSTKNSVLL